jgi:hypothetical protein
LNGECNRFTIGRVDPGSKMHRAVLSALEVRAEQDVAELQIVRSRIRAGLEAQSVERVVARYRDCNGRRKRVCFVAKQLEGAGVR